MDSKMAQNKYFNYIENDCETIKVSTKLPFICDNNISYLLDLIDKIDFNGKKKIQIELTGVETIDRTSLKLIIAKSKQIKNERIKLQLLVSNESPKISFSVGDILSDINVVMVDKPIGKAAYS